MIINDIKCKDYSVVNNELRITVQETTSEEIKEKLFNKYEIIVSTDNEENKIVCDIFYGFAKPMFIKENIEDSTYTVVLRQVSEIETRVNLLEEAINEMLFGREEMIADVTILEETDSNGEIN